MLRRTLIAATLAALAAPGLANAQNPVLRGQVGPGFEITLRDASGATVTTLAPGTYDIVVEDRSDAHNFHLTGPGVNQATPVPGTPTVTWTVTLTAGTYTYVCDPHAGAMRGVFRVAGGGNPPPPPTSPPPPRPRHNHTTAAKRLVATVGSGFTISLTSGGRKATSLKAGTYLVTVRDRSAMHNFHLSGPGVNKKTSLGFRGTVTWRLKLRKGTYRFVCDPHAGGMKGSVRIR